MSETIELDLNVILGGNSFQCRKLRKIISKIAAQKNCSFGDAFLFLIDDVYTRGYDSAGGLS